MKQCKLKGAGFQMPAWQMAILKWLEPLRDGVVYWTGILLNSASPRPPSKVLTQIHRAFLGANLFRNPLCHTQYLFKKVPCRSLACSILLQYLSKKKLVFMPWISQIGFKNHHEYLRPPFQISLLVSVSCVSGSCVIPTLTRSEDTWGKWWTWSLCHTNLPPWYFYWKHNAINWTTES